MAKPKAYQRAAAQAGTSRQNALPKKTAKRRRAGKRKSRFGAVLLVLLVVAVLFVGGLLAYLHFFGPGLFGNKIAAEPRALYSIQGESLSPMEFVSTEDKSLSAEYVQKPSFSTPGAQDVEILLRKNSNELKLTASLYVLDGSTSASIEAGTPLEDISPALFLSESSLAHCIGFSSDLSSLELAGGSTYSLGLLLEGGRSAACTLTVTDTVAPTATPLQDVAIWSCDEVQAMDFLADVQDASPVSAEFAQEPAFNENGKITFDIVLTDSAGNQSVYTASAQVTVDSERPEIFGLEDRTALLNEKISYRSGVEVVDNHPDGAELTIDSSAVDVTAPGTYPVEYTATDKTGNSVSETVVITILDIDEETVNQMAGEILLSITNDSMTQEEKAKAIHSYVHDNIRYVNTGDKSGVLQGAYAAMKEKKGDCYTYYALAQVLLDLAGIENQPIQRVGGTTRHYWSLVNLGDGWYHFDSCPTPSAFNSFMFTNSQARAYTQEVLTLGRVNYYNFDSSLYPEIVE